MDDPFDSPPRRGQGGGRGNLRGGRSRGRNSPDPFGSPRQPPPPMNPFISRGSPPQWRASQLGPGDGNRSRGGGLFGQFGARRPVPMVDDPFGGSSVAGPAERQARQDLLRRVRNYFDETRFRTENSSLATSGLLLRVAEMRNGQAPKRFVVKASFPEVAKAIEMEKIWTDVSKSHAIL